MGSVGWGRYRVVGFVGGVCGGYVEIAVVECEFEINAVVVTRD